MGEKKNMFQTTNQKITMSPCLSEPWKVAHQGDLQATPLKKEIQANISATYTQNLGPSLGMSRFFFRGTYGGT